MTKPPDVIFIGEPLPDTRLRIGTGWIKWAALAALIGVVGWACVTPVTVPLIWPCGSTLLAVALAVMVVRRAFPYRPRTPRDHTTEPQVTGSTTVADLSQSPPPAPAVHAPDELVGDADRDAGLALLAHRYSTGHLTADEVDQRRSCVLGARTCGELRDALRNLPTH